MSQDNNQLSCPLLAQGIYKALPIIFVDISIILTYVLTAQLYPRNIIGKKEKLFTMSQGTKSKDTNSATINNSTSQDEDARNTSQSSASGTTGPGSFQIVSNGDKDFEMEDSRDENKSGSCVDQGADNSEAPRALYTTGEGLPRTGYEPKPLSTKVVDGALDEKGHNTKSTTTVHGAGGKMEMVTRKEKKYGMSVKSHFAIRLEGRSTRTSVQTRYRMVTGISGLKYQNWRRSSRNRSSKNKSVSAQYKKS